MGRSRCGGRGGPDELTRYQTSEAGSCPRLRNLQFYCCAGTINREGVAKLRNRLPPVASTATSICDADRHAPLAAARPIDLKVVNSRAKFAPPMSGVDDQYETAPSPARKAEAALLRSARLRTEPKGATSHPPRDFDADFRTVPYFRAGKSANDRRIIRGCCRNITRHDAWLCDQQKSGHGSPPQTQWWCG